MPTAEDTLLPLLRSYIEKSPAGAAHALESMDESEAVEALAILPPELGARLFPHLQNGYAATLLYHASPELLGEVAGNMTPKRAATILSQLDPETRERCLPHLSDRVRWELREHLSYPEDSVGRIMTSQFLSFDKDMPVQEVTQKMRSLSRKGLPSSYLYVLDEQRRLVGVLNMYSLLIADPETTVGSVMRTEVYTIDGFMPREDALAELSKRRYFAAPVVDSEGHMLGLVRTEDLVSGVHEDVAEDIQKMVGMQGDERTFSPLLFSLRKRLPWLHLNLLTAFMAAAVVAAFEGLIAQITVLAVFLPVVAGQGGNAGAQSLAIVMRGIVMREIPDHRRAYLVFKESVLGIINGLITGVVTGAIAWVWYGNAILGVVVTLGMIVNLFCAGLAGASIPLILKGLRFDPALCSTIILTTVTDVIGFLAFLGFAMLFQSYLV